MTDHKGKAMAKREARFGPIANIVFYIVVVIGIAALVITALMTTFGGVPFDNPVLKFIRWTLICCVVVFILLSWITVWSNMPSKKQRAEMNARNIEIIDKATKDQERTEKEYLLSVMNIKRKLTADEKQGVLNRYKEFSESWETRGIRSVGQSPGIPTFEQMDKKLKTFLKEELSRQDRKAKDSNT